MSERIKDITLMTRCNEWWSDGGASLTWACKMLHCSKETFKSKYAGTAVRVRNVGTAQNAKWQVHPWDVLCNL